ncbi:MAG: hypothetical protein H6934_09585 [Burkholderiaceae bacterium]|nr:hypothetical protein [Burkholderiaceae bacterium]
MIILLRVVFAGGMLLALAYLSSYLLTGRVAHRRFAWRLFVGTLLLGLVFFAGVFIERLVSG